MMQDLCCILYLFLDLSNTLMGCKEFRERSLLEYEQIKYISQFYVLEASFLVDIDGITANFWRASNVTSPQL